MDLNLKDLTVVVTGGSSGIGAAIVQSFLHEGCHVYFCSRSSGKINKKLEEHSLENAKLQAKVLDVTDSEGFSQWLSEIGKVDIFVPNVSALSGDWDSALSIDIKATVANIEAVLPYLEKSQNAAITYIGSKASSFPTPGMDAYGAVKAAMTHYMKTLSKTLISKNIRVNTVSPGDTFISDGFWGAMKQNNPDIYDQTVLANPMGRLCTPEEVAKVVVFMSSPIASFVCGNNWLVDGAATNHIQI